MFKYCVNNEGCEMSLRVGKMYLARQTRDRVALRNGFISVLDDDGEFFLHHKRRFINVSIARRSCKIAKAALMAEAHKHRLEPVVKNPRNRKHG